MKYMKLFENIDKFEEDWEELDPSDNDDPIGEILNINTLVDKTLSDIHMTETKIYFITNYGDKYIMYHEDDCCESVTIEDINGDLNDLIGSPILRATEDINIDDDMGKITQDSFTWTFYNIATIKGHVTIRWFGTSNGYYSERVSFKRLE